MDAALTRVDAEDVKREATAHVAKLAADSNVADMAAVMQRVRRMREEDRRDNTRKTYSKCWRLWEVRSIISPSCPHPPRRRRWC